MRRLLAAGDAKSALKVARRLHRRARSVESAAALADACIARVRGLAERGLLPEAESLVSLLRQDLPLDEGRSFEAARLLAFFGDPGPLVAPLADPQLDDAQKRRRIEDALAQVLIDPAAVETCAELPAGHPLRASAAVIATALAEVTSGRLSCEPEALSMVPRRGPFAGWKLLVRAIHLADRGDSDGCRRCLGMMDPRSAPGQLIPAVGALAQRPQEPPPLPDPAAELFRRLRPDQTRLREALERLDRTIRDRRDGLVGCIRDAAAECERCRPDLLERLRQHISVLGVLHDWPHALIRKGLGRPSLKDARFWRLFAQAMERQGDNAQANAAWARFLRHAVDAGWFAAAGTEAAGVCLHMAERLRHFSKGALAAARRYYASQFDGFAGMYGDQPAEIRRLGPRRGEQPDLFFLDPHELYRRAAAGHPTAEVFIAWLDRLAEFGGPERKTQEAAERWHEAIPDDPRPLVRLMEAAEKRGAFKKALRYLGEAETLDALNPQVRRAKFRLWVASARRHLSHGNGRLLAGDLRQLEAMPQAAEGGRRAVVEAVRALAGLLADEPGRAEAARAEAARCLGAEAAADTLIASVADGCGVRDPGATRRSGRRSAGSACPALAEAFAHAAAAAEDAGLDIQVPQRWRRDLIKELDKAAADPGQMLRLAEAALRCGDGRVAYAAAGCGLRSGEATPYRARLLVARGDAVPDSRAERKADVLRAAGALARRNRDQATAARAYEAFQDIGLFGGGDDEDWKEGLDERAIEAVVAREAGQRAYPRGGRRGGQDEMLIDDLFEGGWNPPRRRRRPGRTRRRKIDDELDAPDLEAVLADAPDEVLEMLGLDLPPALVRVLLKVHARCAGPGGQPPDPGTVMRECPDLAAELAAGLEACEGAGPGPARGRRPRRGKGKRRKRRKR